MENQNIKKKDKILPATEKSGKYYMKKALAHAEKSKRDGEVPVGAVIVYKGRIISSGRNSREKDKDALCHAEINAIRKACKRMGGWRLHECEMYVTLEPCPMCAGAIINSRLKRVTIGTKDTRFGCFGGNVDFNTMNFNHKPEIIFGVNDNSIQEKCSGMMSDFFNSLREKRK